MKQLIELINKYDNIVIFRHNKPDMDALGSQIGLKNIILDNFNNKNVYVVGDEATLNFLGKMDEIDDEIIKNSLAIIVDVAVNHLVSDNRYLLAKDICVIDHHKNDCDINITYKYVDTLAASTTQIITYFATSNNLKLSSFAATCLYSGLITDSNRFMFSLSKEVFNMASILIENGANYKFVYDSLYSESLFRKKMRAYFTSKIKVNKLGLAYLINKKDVYKKFDVDTFTISRGMVSTMADTKEIKIWANFTYERDKDTILCEFRSKEIPIVEVAKKYGGGGHLLACGCTLNDEKDIKNILNDFNDLLKG